MTLQSGQRHWGNGNVFFIHLIEIPQERKVTYYCIICDIKPQNKDTHGVCITMGGGLTYGVPFSAPT